MKKIILSLLFVFATVFAFSQEKVISGVITDSDGSPVVGATVRVPNSDIGTITDIDGSYTLTVPDGVEEVRVSYVTLDEPMMVSVADGTSFNIQFENTDQFIDDVVVTGYSTQARRTFTGSAAKVNAKSVADKNTSDITRALAGEVAGVNVISTGSPGGGGAVRIRGFGSVNGNRSPLYVVDGVAFNGDITTIDPADIESTTVLKDAAATALYGSRGANGVIVITTKKGKKDDSSIRVSVKQGSNMRLLPYYSTIKSPEEYMEIGWNGLYNYGGLNYANSTLISSDGKGVDPYYNIWDTDGAYLIDPATGKFYQNINRNYTPETRRDVYFNNSDRTEVNVGFSGGERKTTYDMSFGLLDDIGYYLKSDFTRYTGKLGLTHEVKPWLKGEMALNYGRAKSNFGAQGDSGQNGFWLERNAPPVYGVYERDANGDVVLDRFGDPLPDFGEGRRGFSPLSSAVAVNRYDTNYSENGNFQGSAQLVATFLKDFTATGRFGYGNNEVDGDYRDNPFYGQSVGSGGAIGKLKTELGSYTTLQMLTYSKELGDHVFNLNAAHEANTFDYKYQYNSATGLADPYGLDLANAIKSVPGTSWARDFNLESYFAFGDYSFKDKYFVNASVRRDGSSRFADGNKWGTFPAVGVGWLASDEPFLSSSKVIDYLKVKASWGITGDQGLVRLGSAIGNNAPYYRGEGDLYTVNTLGDSYAFTFDALGNDDLTWEEHHQIDFGIETELFDRISANIDFYSKTTKNLYFTRRRAPSTGISTVLVNDGELLNQGFEFDILGKIVDKNDLKVDLQVIANTLKNELTVAPIDPSTGLTKPVTDEGLFGWAEGYSIYDYYMYESAGVNPDNGSAQWVQYYNDTNSNGAVDEGEGILDLTTYQANNTDINLQRTVTENPGDATQFYTGQSAIPDLKGSTRLTVEYKGVELTGQFLYSLGGYGFDSNYRELMGDDNLGGNNWHTDIRNRWQNPGDITDVPKLTNGESEYASRANATSTRFLEKNNYALLNNVKLSYNLPENTVKKLGMKDLTVYASGDGLWAKTARDGYFPWMSESNSPGRYGYDPLSTVTGGVTVKF